MQGAGDAGLGVPAMSPELGRWAVPTPGQVLAPRKSQALSLLLVYSPVRSFIHAVSC